jgi:hypothetical protein
LTGKLTVRIAIFVILPIDIKRAMTAAIPIGIVNKRSVKLVFAGREPDEPVLLRVRARGLQHAVDLLDC